MTKIIQPRNGGGGNEEKREGIIEVNPLCWEGVRDEDGKVEKHPFMKDVLCSYCELEVITKNAWDEKVDSTEQMCIYCQKEIQS